MNADSVCVCACACDRLQVAQTAGAEAGRVRVQPVQPVPHRSSSAHHVQPAQSVAQDGRPHVPDVARPSRLLRLLPRGARRASERRLPVPARPSRARQRRRRDEVRVHAQHAALSSEVARRIPRTHVID